LQALQPHAGSSSIAIIGASGGTGHVAIQVARCLGFGTIIAVTSPRNIDFCRSLGATHTVDYTKNRVAQEIQTIAPQVDVIMDCVTSADPRDATYEYPKQLRHLCRQRYIRLGGPTFDWFRAGLEKALPIPCFGKEKLFWIRFPKSSQELAQLKQWCEEGKLKSSVAERVKFTQEDVQKAFDDILTRRVRGKLVVQVNPEDKS
jgi:NADPH:quinone reductase-like Zn-dependent oxidoreductase